MQIDYDSGIQAMEGLFECFARFLLLPSFLHNRQRSRSFFEVEEVVWTRLVKGKFRFDDPKVFIMPSGLIPPKTEGEEGKLNKDEDSDLSL